MCYVTDVHIISDEKNFERRNFSEGTVHSQQLHTAAQIVTILSIKIQNSPGLHIIKLTGRVAFNISYL